MAFLSPKTAAVILVIALFGAPVSGQTTSPRSLSDLDLETAETRLALEKTLKENLSLQDEIQQLKEKLMVAEVSAAKLTESASMARQESELFRRQVGELKLRLEALGLTGGGNSSKLEQRLLAAVNDLRHSEEERKKIQDALIALVEATMSFAKSAPGADPAARLALESQLRSASDALGKPPEAANVATLTDGQIISVKEELALVVANIGSRQGVAVGMPFQVMRGDRTIGYVRVVDVRDRIAGAIVQDLTSEKEKFKVGDRLRVAARP